MKHSILVLLFVFAELPLLAQKNTEFQHVPNLHIFLKNKKVKKIQTKMPITFYFSKTEDSLITERVVSGYVKRVIDSVTFEVLPTKIFEEKHLNKKVIETMVYNFDDNNIGKIETIGFSKYITIAYESKGNKITRSILKGISIGTALAALVTIPYLKDPKSKYVSVYNSIDVTVPKLLVFQSITFTGIKILFNPTKYKVYLCETCNPKSNYYYLKEYSRK